MSTATLTFTDSPDGTTNIRVEFGEGGIDKNSAAHYFAVKALAVVREAQNDADEDDEGDDA